MFAVLETAVYNGAVIIFYANHMSNKKVNLILWIVVLLVGGFFILYKMQGGFIKLGNNDDGQNQQKVEHGTEKKNEDVIPSDDSDDADVGIVYYYGEECPHCKKVAEFLDKNGVYGKVDFTKKEVWHNRDNGEELMKRAQKCGIDPNGVGVPFLYANGKCYIGDADVIEFFKSKIKE